MQSTALLTDRYELTMLQAAIADGVAELPATFEAFARRLPRGRRYGVVAGIGRVVEAPQAFTFTPEQVEHLQCTGVVNEQTAAYLRGFRFTGTVTAYREGETCFPGSPVLTVDAPFGEAVLLETLVLSILNHDCAIAAAAARMVQAAAGRPLIEMGSRRTGEQSAVAAYLVGFTTTSNLQAGYQYGVPTAGTAAHAFALATRRRRARRRARPAPRRHDERTAFAAQVAAAGAGTTLLVDTDDIETGIRTAVDVAGNSLGAVRTDSGDPRVESVRARSLLDELGARHTCVVITGDLDEHRIAALADSPVDTLGVGTSLVTGSGAPTAEMVHKLVAIANPQRASDAGEESSVGERRGASRPSG